ncbi:MAG TPA: hypothetical protein VHG93_13380 [Longimicrobium sp.]|nr:hypothetical protein [Longimicrobium sp.]
MRILLPALLLLAACSGSDAGKRASTDGAAPSAANLQQPAAPAVAAREAAEPPDFADPRRFLDLDSLRWREWETDPPAGRMARLRELGITPVRTDSTVEFDPADGYDPNGENVKDFHFVDFSGDGVADVIYDGPWFIRNENGFGALEGSHVKLWQVIGGRAVLVLDHHGAIQRMWKGHAGQPLAFRTLHHGCCADPEWKLQYHRPVRRGDTVRYELHHHVMGREGLELPVRFLDAPRRFTVANDRYLLRAAPRVQDTVGPGEEDWYTWNGRGNVVAEYGRGAHGTALAERTDSTGRVWWFVRMDGATPPLAAQSQAPEDEHGRRAPVDRLGWMSSRFLTPAP